MAAVAAGEVIDDWAQSLPAGDRHLVRLAVTATLVETMAAELRARGEPLTVLVRLLLASVSRVDAAAREREPAEGVG